MLTSRALGLLAALVLPALIAVPADASDADVTVANMMFSPSSVTVGMGETVTWTFADTISHTATSDDGFFNTGAASGGATRTIRFPSSGTFAYHCQFHPMMTGKVVVPLAASTAAKGGWRLRWLSGDNPAGRSYDVQVRRVGTKTWTWFRKATTAASGRFHPSSGSWTARARTRKGSATSGWSPIARLS